MMAPAKDLGELLKGIPAGAWVAIAYDESKVIVYAPDEETAIRKAQEQGEPNPIITRVPELPGIWIF